MPKKIGILAVLVLCGMAVAAVPFSLAQPADQQRADQLWQEKSYRLAAEQYSRLLAGEDLDKNQRRELRFKQADSAWRTNEQDRYEVAVKTLKELIEGDERDRWWAEANESLAEHYLQVNRWQHANEIKAGFESAREYWAGSKDLNVARRRFIEITFALGDFISSQWGWGYQGIKPLATDGVRVLPPDQPQNAGLYVIYEELLKVTRSDEDRARVYYSLGMSSYQNYYDQKQKDKAAEYFTKVIKEYSDSEWVDDAYYYLGQYHQQRNDLQAALDAYHGLLQRFRKGESQWVNNAQSQVESIVNPQINISTAFTFLPGSEVQFGIGWKNIRSARLTIYPLNLIDHLQFDPATQPDNYRYGLNNYQEMLSRIVEKKTYRRLTPVVSVPLNLKNEGKYQHYNENKGLAEWLRSDDNQPVDPSRGVLAPGAYLVLVQAQGVEAYDLVMVTDMGVATKTAGHSGLVYAFDGQTGEPRSAARVKYQYRYYNDRGNWAWEQGEGQTDDDGILTFPLKANTNRNYNNQHELFAVVEQADRQAFAQGRNYSYSQNRQWWIYAYSDRPAYRPNEEISFKTTLRGYDQDAFFTPARQPVAIRVYDPRGNQVLEKEYVLNDFGTFSDALTLDEKAPLGEYRMEVYSAQWQTHYGSAPLFRLEEYKLPEFIVSVSPRPNEDGQTAYQLGDEIEVELDAKYYFGGGVENADVEYLIYQSPYYHSYHPPREYPWYYAGREALRGRHNYYNSGTLIKKESIKTDAEGKAVFSFETPENNGQDLEYRIEVRVVDQSRREISSTARIKVTKNSFYAYLRPKNQIYRPGDKAQIEIKTLTANNAPVGVDGRVQVLRNWWREPVGVNERMAKPAGYAEEEMFSKFVKTDERGEAVFDFEPGRDGYYVVKFTGYDRNGKEVTAQTNVFVCDKQSRDLGYRYGGLQIIPEKDTYTIGETARVMLVTEKPGAWVLFTAEVDEIFGHQMHFLEGTVKLLEFEVRDEFSPNIFLGALSVDNYQVRMQNLQLVVPPDRKFLNINVTSDKEVYRPRETGVFDITVTDHMGNPVSGEVSLGLVDASVYYIQEEYVKDIREFFYGELRPLSVQTNSSFSYKQYKKLVRGDDTQLVPEDVLKMQKQREKMTQDKDIGATRQLRMEGKELSRQVMNERVDMLAMADGMAASAPAVASESRSRGMVFRKTKSEMAFADDEMDMPMEEAELAAGGGSDLQEPTVRQDFRSTAYWQPSVITDENGKATVKVSFPDSLTTWRATARGISRATDVGNVTYDAKTSKDVIVRLQAPRFFTERDEVIISANVHNYTDDQQKIKVLIKSEGLRVLEDAERWIEVPAGGEQRVDWRTVAEQQGTARITVSAQATADADAMVKSYPVIPHGIEKFIAESTAVRLATAGAEARVMEFQLPKERVKESTTLTVNLSPSLAATMLDALPYLANYPYGCVEQTLSRFLPAVIVRKALRDLGLSEGDVNDYIRNVLIPREDPRHPQRRSNSTLDELDEMTAAGLDRLYDFQHDDGGWGWWKGGNSDRFMTAYVLWGLSEARAAGLQVKGDVFSRAVRYLQLELVEAEDQPDMLAWMLHALGAAKSRSKFEDKQIARLWERRAELNPYTRALFAISQHYRGDAQRATVLARNLANGMIEDKDNGTLHWGESGVYYRFSEGGVEATAFVIKALANIDPQSRLIPPAVKWMALNRRGARWKNTRDTAIAILGLADYLKTTNELNPDLTFSVKVNGRQVREQRVDRTNIFSFERRIELPGDMLHDGRNTVEIFAEGAGSLYASGYLKYFTLEENIAPAGNEVYVERRYFIEDTAETLLRGYDTDWRPLESGDEVTSGDRIRVEITLEAKNNYEYLVLEDFKPAGLEAVSLKSGDGYAEQLDRKGKPSGERTRIYQEFRDQKAAFFVSELKQGKHKLTYELRAEVPGTFHGMPNQTHAMYVPEIRANSAEMTITVGDRE